MLVGKGIGTGKTGTWSTPLAAVMVMRGMLESILTIKFQFDCNLSAYSFVPVIAQGAPSSVAYPRSWRVNQPIRVYLDLTAEAERATWSVRQRSGPCPDADNDKTLNFMEQPISRWLTSWLFVLSVEDLFQCIVEQGRRCMANKFIGKLACIRKYRLRD